MVLVFTPIYLSFLYAWARLTTVGSQISVNADGIWANVFSNHRTALPYLKCSECYWLKLLDRVTFLSSSWCRREKEHTLSYDMQQLRVHYTQVDLKGISPLLAWKTGPREQIKVNTILAQKISHIIWKFHTAYCNLLPGPQACSCEFAYTPFQCTELANDTWNKIISRFNL